MQVFIVKKAILSKFRGQLICDLRPVCAGHLTGASNRASNAKIESMGVIGEVGRRRPRARIAMFFLYAILCLGAVTTIYPFLIMGSTGLKSSIDQNDNKLIPSYLLSVGVLNDKFVDDKYAGDQDAIAATRSGANANPQLLNNYAKFLMSLPPDYYSVGFRDGPNDVTSRLNIRYQNWIKHKFPTIDALNKIYIEEDLAFETVSPPAEELLRPLWNPVLGPKYRDWLTFKKELPSYFRIPVTMRLIYQNWIRGKYHNSFSAVPSNIAGSSKRFGELTVPKSGALLSEFRSAGVPKRYSAESTETLWLKFNHQAVKGDPLVAGSSVIFPTQAAEISYVGHHVASLRWEFATRDFRYVFYYLVLNGGSFWTTLVYCFLAIVTTLFVNGLAAYALSRYPVRQSAKILIFLLATMAFPAEVAMIPNFLLLKSFGLLNTYSALILPAAASGYMIFLLKGFFDSLPQELFEAGALDGAPELLMMRKIAIPLSLPVFGFFALITFIAAYGNFLYAFLVAQDQRMWTVMVFIYQLSGIAPKHVMMAASLLAALPTLLVFLACQRVIERGIVLPAER